MESTISDDVSPGGQQEIPTEPDLTMHLPPPENSGESSEATINLTGKAPISSDLTIALTGAGNAASVENGTFIRADDSSQASADTQSFVSNYEVLDVLGRGAVGVVYKAQHLGLRRTVALKMLLAGTHASALELARFRTEAEAVARLQHANIVQVYEVGTHQGLPFFSLEFVEGGSLAQHMAGKPLPAQEAARLLEALARAMHYAHQQNILHRDLKPANILLTPDRTPKISDFGLAKRLEDNESHQTRTGTLMGTPSYMAPEQATGNQQAIGPHSDQYGLGAILYETLVGRPPFLGTTVLDTLHQVRTQEPVPPRQLQPKVPRDLETICLKCLHKEPGKRYADAGQLADDLKRFRAGEPIHARPIGTGERLWRWCRRNPRVAVLSAALLVLGLLLAGSGGILTVRLMREQQAIVRMHEQAEERLEQASAAIAGGDVQRARDLLQWSDLLLANAAELAEVRGRWNKLRERVEVYGRFQSLLDDARFACWFGSRSQKEQGRQYCRQLLALYDTFEAGPESAAGGLPPLNAEQQQLFKEDVFEMFLVAALVERELTAKADTGRQQQMARQALAWLDRAEAVLPGTRALHAHRSDFHRILGQQQACEADIARARGISPDSAIDHFWHGYAERLRGEAAASAGDPTRARQHFQQEIAEYAALLQQRPGHFWGYFNWAATQMQVGDLNNAVIGFTACIHQRPSFPWSYNNRGTALLRLRQYERAVRDYSTALEQSPDYVDARVNRALAYLEQGRLEQALTDCNAVVDLSPSHAAVYWHRAECYRRRKQYDRALADFGQLLALNENKVEVYLKRAAVYREMKRSDEALRDYDQAADRQPKNAWVRYVRAGLHVERGEYRQAEADYTAAIALQPRAAEPYHDRALVHWLYRKDFNAALDDWGHVAQLRPSDPEPHRCLGAIYLGCRQYHAALSELDEALARRPDYAEALWAKAQIYLWRGMPKKALEVIGPVADKAPVRPAETLNIRGDILRRLGRRKEAAADYRSLIQQRPDLPEAYVSLALVYLQQGEPAKARECLDQLVAANPRSLAAYLRRGRFLRDQGQLKAASKDVQQAAECDPRSVLPGLLQASIRAAQGDVGAVAEAERILDRAGQENGQVLYAAVQVWSLASAAAARAGKPDLARQYADRAVALLAETLDTGFHDLIYPEHNRMLDDPALESIRQHPQGRKLLSHQL
jgi:tetratricopeptide (TPR) repeat protein/tRNA A-37 threonylcarbamoyl transferase component Bud32